MYKNFCKKIGVNKKKWFKNKQKIRVKNGVNNFGVNKKGCKKAKKLG